MKNYELSQYINHYMEFDKTHSAIMLTAPWGAGKSYYIKEELIPFLISARSLEKNPCVVVSLYGSKSLYDINKRIYMELRSFKIFSETEGVTAAKIVGKTILNNVSQLIPYVKIETQISDADLELLYNSIDLTGKLIIFEDIERSGIDLIEFLGYVNNLVEQDGVKVLLVANEEEIVGGNGEKETIEKYLKIKEKTISDTIKFQGEYETAIKNIVEKFENKTLNGFIEGENLDIMVEIIKSISGNLRSFNFGCQKAINILEQCKNISKKTQKCVFMGIILYSLKYKKQDNIVWDGSGCFSFELGNEEYPLLYPCFQYINNFQIDNVALKDVDRQYLELLSDREKVGKLEKLNKIYSYHIYSEIEVKKALDSLVGILEDDKIPYSEYLKLGYYIITVGNVVCYKIDAILNKLISNIKQSEKIELDEYNLFVYDRMIDEKEKTEQYVRFKSSMLDAITLDDTKWFGFDYKRENLKKFYDDICKKTGAIYSSGRFACKMDILKFIEMLEKCNSEELDTIRGIFFSIYRNEDSSKEYQQDVENLKQIIEAIKEFLQEENRDKIEKMHLKWMEEQLNVFLRIENV